MSAGTHSSPDDEAALIRAACGGDSAAFGRLYDRYLALVVRRLSHLVGPAGAVEDLTQETFLRAMRALGGYRGERPFRHWLLRVAASVAMDDIRRRRRSLWRLFTVPEEIDEAPGEGRSAEARAELSALHRALGELSPKLREVVVLFELEGESLSEIAAELGVPLHTVASRLRRGREQLRRHFERSGAVEESAPLPLAGARERA